jgi:hypothetical protein
VTDDQKSGIIALPNGHVLEWRGNEVGGRTYWSSEIQPEVFVWDTVLVDKTTLLAAIVNEGRLLKDAWVDKHWEGSK